MEIVFGAIDPDRVTRVALPRAVDRAARSDGVQRLVTARPARTAKLKPSPSE